MYWRPLGSLSSLLNWHPSKASEPIRFSVLGNLSSPLNWAYRNALPPMKVTPSGMMREPEMLVQNAKAP